MEHEMATGVDNWVLSVPLIQGPTGSEASVRVGSRVLLKKIGGERIPRYSEVNLRSLCQPLRVYIARGAYRKHAVYFICMSSPLDDHELKAGWIWVCKTELTLLLSQALPCSS